MAQAPVWITEAGSLGTVPEGKFYKITLEAEDPDFPGASVDTDLITADDDTVTADLATPVSYSLVAGTLPEGIQVDVDGIIAGIPVSIAETRGVPAEVSENVTSKFVIRATDFDGRIADRTFTLTVTGQDKPEWVTPEGSIGTWLDSSEVSFQFEATDLDPNDELEIVLIDGELPEGLTLTTDGLLSGYALPYAPLGTPESKTYEFTLRLSDEKDVSLRTFEIEIFNRDAITADTDLITVDQDNITADSVTARPPYITNNVASIGTFRHDNYFAHQFLGVDPDGGAIQYYISTGSLPSGLALNLDTGWLTGYLPAIAGEETFEFGVQVRKVIDPTNESLLYETAMTLVSDMGAGGAEWVTDPDLGTIGNGEVSTITIEASYEGSALQYRLGPCSRLPQGLQLSSDGELIGRTSFKMTAFDCGITTFEEDFDTRLTDDPTTFDRTYVFTVEAYTADSSISITREFTIVLDRTNAEPFNVLYCKAMPPREDRDLIDALLFNQDTIPNDLLYRPSDPNFGSAQNVNYVHAYGLSRESTADYFAALDLNHYNKRLVLGEIKTAQALDDFGEVVYEVVYSQIVDDLVNSDGNSVAAAQTIKYPAIDNGSSVTTVYPNSLENMREQVIAEIGQVSKILPRWMLSKQEDGEVLGFTPAWVIAYAKPGQSKQLQYNISQVIDADLNLIDFEIDRYTLESDLLDTCTGDAYMTTFDRESITVDITSITADSDRLVSADPPETTFDCRATRFGGPVDTFNAGSDSNDQYIKFPREQIINNEQ